MRSPAAGELAGAATAQVAQSWPQHVCVLTARTLLIALIALTLQLQGSQQAAAALPAASISLQAPQDLRCRSSSADGAAIPEE